MKNLFNFKKEKISSKFENDNVHPKVYEHLNSVIKLDTNGHLIAFNVVFVQQYGYEEKDFKKPFLDAFLKNYTPEQKGYFKNAVSGLTQGFNAIGVCKNGKTKEIFITLIPDKIGPYIYIIINNIEKLKSDKNELLLPPKWQKTLSGFEGICNFYYDAINDYHYFSDQLPEIFGISIEQPFKPSFKLLLQFVHEKDRIRVNDTVQKALQDRTGYQMEYRIVRKDQSIRYLFEQTEIILDRNGNLDGIVGFIQDITNRKISNEVQEKEKQLMAAL